MSRFRMVGGRPMADAAERAAGPECGVELTEVRSGRESWWSLGLEATGPVSLLRSTLQSTAALMFAHGPPGDVELELSHSQSYAEWLSRHQVTAAVHPAELRNPCAPEAESKPSPDQRPHWAERRDVTQRRPEPAGGKTG